LIPAGHFGKGRKDIMRLSYGSIIFVSVILAAVSIAGCFESPSAPTATPVGTATPAGTTATPAATTAPAGGPTTLGAAIDFSKVHWFEYRMTMSGAGSQDMSQNLKMEYNVDYKGAKADKMTAAGEMKVEGGTMSTTTEMYMDHAQNSKVLGGHVTSRMDGKVVNDMDIPASTGSTPTTGSINPLGTNTGATLTNAGPDTVSVPGYTGAATKYTWKTSDGNTGTAWIAPNVPLPVKMTGGSGSSTFTMELAGWG
jgi:hypothetical protein